MQSKPEKIFVVDGSSLLYRSFYAIRPLFSQKGVPTNAVVGFFKCLDKLFKNYKPENLVVAWDTKGCDRTDKIYSEYKANRQKAPDDLIIQKDYIVKILDLMQICQLSEVGKEADDIIAKIAQSDYSKKVVIVSTDKDLLQLVNEKNSMLDLFKEIEYKPEGVIEKYEFGPEKINFFYSLVGDSSDNIPGVKGIGKKGATEIVKKFDSLDDLYKNIEKIEKERTKKLLLEGRENAFLSQKLFTPLDDVKSEIDLGKIKLQSDLWPKANQIFQELNLNYFLAKSNKNSSDFESPSNYTKLSDAGYDLRVVYDEKELDDLLSFAFEKKIVAIDLETTGVCWWADKIVGVSFAFDDKSGFYVPFGHKDFETKELVKKQIKEKKVAEKIKQILVDDSITKIFHNAKFDTHFLRKDWGIKVKGLIVDTAIAARILTPEWQRVGLKYLSMSMLFVEREECKDLLKKYKTFDFVPLDEAGEYSAADALQTFQVYQKLKPQLEQNKELNDLFFEVEMPVSKILMEMEHQGICFDVAKCSKMQEKVNQSLRSLEDDIFQILTDLKVPRANRYEFNLNSAKQVSNLIFNILGLGGKKDENKTYSVDEKTLEELSEKSPIPGMIIKYRKAKKLSSTYLEALPKEVNQNSGRIHTSYSQVIVSTGRLSSRDPNLQNIPVSQDESLDVRRCFVAPKGKKLISADYSQIELRVLAELCQDPVLLEAFSQGKDIHQSTAAKIFHKPFEQISKYERSLAKRVNFGIIYGLSAFGLAKDMQISQKDAKNYIEEFFNLYQSIKPWMEQTIELAGQNGFVKTFLGRRRWFQGLNDRNKIVQNAARRAAVNAVIQGSASDIIKLAMVKLEQEIAKSKIDCKMLLQVHDELVFEVDQSSLDKASALIKQTMQEVACNWKVKLPVNIKSGESWGEI